ATFNLAGKFDNQATNPTLFHWESGPLTMNGSSPKTFEAAGNDFGPRNPAGFTNNFAMGTLRIEPARTVDVRNDFPNRSAGCEVLYVDTLSLGAGCTFRLNGCNVYYRTLVKESGASVVLIGVLCSSALMSTNAGDLNGDNHADLADVNLFVTVLLGGSC